MALGTLGSTLNDELNRLANGGTYRNMDQMVDEALAAKQWANRENINPYSTDTVGILNEIAGLGLDKKNWLDFNGVCNYIAGTTGLPAAAALRQVYPTTDLLTGVASYYVDAAYPTGLTSTPGYVYLNGAAGNNMSTPDSNALDISSDIDIRAQIALDDWTPASDIFVVSKTASGNDSYSIIVNAAGTIRLSWVNSSATTINANSTVAPTIADGGTLWIRATLDADNGASGNTVTFFTSNDGTNWTQLGSTVTQAGVTNIRVGTAPLYLGAYRESSQMMSGKFYRAQIRNGIDGTVVFDANMANVSLTATSFTESSSNAATVTINGSRAYPQTADNLGAAGSLLPTTLGSSTAADSNDPKFLDFTGTNYVYTPGVTNNYLSVPDSAALDITGDIDLRWYGALDDWTPSGRQVLISKADVSQSYRFNVETNGVLSLWWYADGTTLSFAQSTVAPTIADGAPLWVRATLDVDNGASGNTTTFFTSTNGTTWTQLGSAVTQAGVTSIFAGTSPVSINQLGAGSGTVSAGKVFRAQIFNGIDGTKVLDVDTSTLQTGADAYIVPTTYSGAAGAFFTGTGLSLNGVAGNYVSTPDASQLDITGDIDIAVQVALADWTPSSNNMLISKYNSSIAGARSYQLMVGPSGFLNLQWSTDGSTLTNNISSTAANTIPDGTASWVRATLDVNNGASGNDVKFYTSTDGTTWTQLGSTVTTAGVTSIFSGSAQLEIGSRNVGTADFANGTFYRAVVKSGIDGFPVFDATFVGVPANSLRMIESSTYKAVVTLNTTRYCTINRSTSGRKTVAVTQPTWLFGTDDYMEVNNRYMSSGTYLYLPGVAGNYASTPDSAAVSVTGDIDLRVKVALDDWTPAANTDLLTKMLNASTRSYRFGVNTTGNLLMVWSADGTNTITATSTVATGIADGTTKWVRATLDVNNGASGNDVQFFTSDDGSSWTQLGTTVTTAGVTSIFDTGASLEVGSLFAGTSNLARGKFFRAQVRNGINGTVAFDANFETSITSLNQTSFTESSANAATVTINRSGSAYRSAGITTAGYLYPGATNTFAASATDFLNFGASDSFTVFAVWRQWDTTPTKVIISSSGSIGGGYFIYQHTLNRAYFQITDTVQFPSSTVSIPVGSLATLSGVRNVTLDRLEGYLGTANPVTTTDTTTGTLRNFGTLRIGAQFNGVNADAEIYAAAVFRQALTASQIRQIANYFANREVYL